MHDGKFQPCLNLPHDRQQHDKMSELSYQHIRSANQAREADEIKTETRKKNLLILVLQYLNDEGYLESSQTLARETNIDLSRFEVCDNIDLETILMEYESYYFVKFNRYPKITKKLSQSADDGVRKGHAKAGKFLKGMHKSTSTPSLPKIPNRAPSPPVHGNRPKSGAVRRVNGLPPKKDSKNPSLQTLLGNPAGNLPVSSEEQALQGLMVQGSNSVPEAQSTQGGHKQKNKFGQIIDVRAMLNDVTRLNVEEGSDPDNHLLKPLGGYIGYNSEWRELAQIISRDIFSNNPNVRWNDIIGLENAKRLVKEAVVYPIKYPQLFTGILSPWKGLLLYGPPGTGKTLLAKAVATECGTTFFNISASSIVSKWRGDSEKLVRVLFELARFHAPSTIFLDELESLMSQRGSQGGGGEHEGSRRMKTELLVQMDGLAKTDDLVFLLAASNLPWELDHAMLRRLEKRILVGLPTREARRAMFMHHLPPLVNQKEDNGLELRADLDYNLLGDGTEGYSGSDIRLVCKEAAMRPVRKVFDALENITPGEELNIELDSIQTEDVLEALSRTKPSARTLAEKYLAWQKEYESV